MLPYTNYVSPSSIIRVTNISNELQRLNYDCDVRYVHLNEFKENLAAIIASDVVVFHRIQASKATVIDPTFLPLLYLSKHYGKKVIFDLDDAIFLTFPFICELCILNAHAVFAGSHFLYSYAKSLNPRTYLVPSSVNAELFKTSGVNSKNKANAIISWHGSAIGHFRNIKILKSILSELCKKYDVTFRLLGAWNSKKIQEYFRKILGIKVDFGPPKWVPYDRFPRFLLDVDIGVSPLVDDLWNRGKCAMKVLEYMALEKPVVASDVGEHRYIIKSGRNGFLAKTTDEWVVLLSNLIENCELRKKIGKEARETVVFCYSLNKVSRKIGNILENLN